MEKFKQTERLKLKPEPQRGPELTSHQRVINGSSMSHQRVINGSSTGQRVINEVNNESSTSHRRVINGSSTGQRVINES
ncbi:Hypothetical predicted protein [Xyrichtys novacula]|uniref:Uncharacterized protein n=1 Tax=Xyrichtys novacula TaxID=13765 RepID=A0AAV1GMX3_XYRNO|nr:Hypothetical predicted protein [Xyrichtys novacula]